MIKTWINLMLSIMVGFGLVSTNAVAEDDLGRLFSRPHERKHLDVLRKNQALKVVTPKDTQLETAAVVAPVELPDPISMQGFVKRSDGASTLWINNQAVQEDSAVDDVQVGRLGRRSVGAKSSADSLHLSIPANGRKIQLKPGQVYEPETNQTKEFKLLAKEKQLRLEETGVSENGVIE
jgi:hypothetical protein